MLPFSPCSNAARRIGNPVHRLFGIRMQRVDQVVYPARRQDQQHAQHRKDFADQLGITELPGFGNAGHGRICDDHGPCQLGNADPHQDESSGRSSNGKSR